MHGARGGRARARREAGRASASPTSTGSPRRPQAAGRLVKVGFNHRFHPAIARALAEARSGRYGDADARPRAATGTAAASATSASGAPTRARRGGGELVDQGMHLLDLVHWLLGPLPLHSALLRTQLLGQRRSRTTRRCSSASAAHARAVGACCTSSWTEWKNLFSLEIYCRTAKLQVDGLAAPTGRRRLPVYAMKPELGPPDVEEIEYPADDVSWERSGAHSPRPFGREMGVHSGDLDSAAYGWRCIEEAYRPGATRRGTLSDRTARTSCCRWRFSRRTGTRLGDIAPDTPEGSYRAACRSSITSFQAVGSGRSVVLCVGGVRTVQSPR